MARSVPHAILFRAPERHAPAPEHGDRQERTAMPEPATDTTSCLDHPLLAPHLDAIRALCREFGVRRLEVFGSICTGEFDPERSDIDFLIEYLPETDLGPWMGRYFELTERLGTILDRPVDLIMSGAPTNPYFVRSLNQTRQLLYAA